MMVAHARVVNYFKENELPGEIGVVHSLETKYAATDAPEDKRCCLFRRCIVDPFH